MNVFTLDTREDRREIWGLLHRLTPAERLGYLTRCCEAVKDGLGNGLFPLPSMRGMVKDADRCDRGDDRLTNTVYCDLLQLSVSHNLDLVAVALELEHLARGRRLPQPARLRAV